MKNWMIALPIAALAMAGAANAQDTAKPARAENAVVTKADAQARAAAMFAKLDVNKDGKLDQADRAARFEERRGKMFDRLDTNKDGSITRAEFTTMKPRENAPGTEAGEAKREGKDGRGVRHGWGKRGHHGMMGYGRGADANGDKAVTQAEFVANAVKRFDALDTNKDGKVTPEERQAAREQWKAKRQEMRAAKTADTSK